MKHPAVKDGRKVKKLNKGQRQRRARNWSCQAITKPHQIPDPIKNRNRNLVCLTCDWWRLTSLRSCWPASQLAFTLLFHWPTCALFWEDDFSRCLMGDTPIVKSPIVSSTNRSPIHDEAQCYCCPGQYICLVHIVHTFHRFIPEGPGVKWNSLEPHFTLSMVMSTGMFLLTRTESWPYRNDLLSRTVWFNPLSAAWIN